MHPAIAARRDAVAAVCRRFGVRRLDVFGCGARGADFGPASSDADLLVEFAPQADPGLTGFLDLKEALEEALGRPVDLVERAAVERSRNHLRRAAILGGAETLYLS